MKIALIASEIAPVAKVGGLADVILGLGRALKKKKHSVQIFIPKYDCIFWNEVNNLQVHEPDVEVEFGGEIFTNTLWKGEVSGLDVFFFEDHHPGKFFSRGTCYGAEDDPDRFLYFSNGVLASLLKMGKNPDVIHLHDWQTAICAPLIQEIYSKKGLSPKKVVFTIHNIAYQGQCPQALSEKVGLTKVEGLADPFIPDSLNLLKGGIVFSDRVTTVSPTYAEEVKFPEGGRGLEGILREHETKFSGVLNGLDTTYWDPSTDPILPYHFKPLKKKGDSKFWTGKKKCKKELQKRFCLRQVKAPIVASVGRLVPQKGLDLIKHALFRTLELGGQFVLIGVAPDPAVHAEFLALETQFADNPDIHLELQHNEGLVHLIFGGSDFLIVPSLFEPCGLTQMIALTYGTVPIVRKTGGLSDTIEDIDTSEAPKEMRNGYTFDYPDVGGMNWALDRALGDYKKNPEQIEEILIAGFNRDFSWGASSNEYLKLYKD